MQKLVKTGNAQKSLINKQSNVKFWLNRRKYGTVSYSSNGYYYDVETCQVT